MVGVPDGIGEQVGVRGRRSTSSTIRRCPRAEVHREGRGALPQGVGRPADLEARRSRALLGRRPAQDRQAIDQAARGGGGDRAPAPQERGEQGRAGARRARAARWPGCSRRSRPCRGGARADVQLGSRFGELGFDSLMYAELSSALETAGDRAARERRRHDAGHASRSCRSCWRAGRRRRRASWPPSGGAATTTREIRVPEAVSAAGKRGPRLGAARLLPERARDRGDAGRATSPSTPTSSSPPTTARTWTWARSRWRSATPGRDLTSLAAADYFFRNRYRRAYFKHFTNLVPMERVGLDPQVDGHRRERAAPRAAAWSCSRRGRAR